MTRKRDGNLNLFQLKSLVEVNVLKVTNIFVEKRNRGLMQNLPPNLTLFHTLNSTNLKLDIFNSK